jgi:hypothetical protein
VIKLLWGFLALAIIFIGLPLFTALGLFGPEDTMPKEEDYYD